MTADCSINFGEQSNLPIFERQRKKHNVVFHCRKACDEENRATRMTKFDLLPEPLMLTPNDIRKVQPGKEWYNLSKKATSEEIFGGKLISLEFGVGRKSWLLS